MGKTSIEWTDASWNPIVGCTEISPGCANCYAARLSGTRLAHNPAYKGLATIETQGSLRGQRRVRWTGEVRLLPERLEEPLHWKKPRRIFVCDMGDLFHPDVKREWIHKVFDTIRRSPQHTFQILTKRAERMRRILLQDEGRLGVVWPLPNVWLGVSVENQAMADKRIPDLLATPGPAVRFLSCEPLLGRLDIDRWFCCDKNNIGGHLHLPSIDWIIAGGESGTHARAMDPAWLRSLRDQCQAAGVPFFFKQWGEFAPVQMVASGCTFPGVKIGDQLMLRYGKKRAGRLLDGREWNEFPTPTP